MKEFNSTKNEWLEPEAGPIDDHPMIYPSSSHEKKIEPKIEPRYELEPVYECVEPKYPPQTVITRTDESHVAVSFSIRLNIYPMTIALGVIGCLYGVYHLIVKNSDP